MLDIVGGNPIKTVYGCGVMASRYMMMVTGYTEILYTTSPKYESLHSKGHFQQNSLTYIC